MAQQHERISFKWRWYLMILLSIESLGLNTGQDGLSMFVVDVVVLAAGCGFLSDQTGLQSVRHLTVRGTFYDLRFSKHLDSWARISAGTGVLFFRRKTGILYWYRGVATVVLTVGLTISIITVKHFQAEVRTGRFDSLEVFKVWRAETSHLQHFLVYYFCLGLKASCILTNGPGHQGSVVNPVGSLHLNRILWT